MTNEKEGCVSLCVNRVDLEPQGEKSPQSIYKVRLDVDVTVTNSHAFPVTVTGVYLVTNSDKILCLRGQWGRHPDIKDLPAGGKQECLLAFEWNTKPLTAAEFRRLSENPRVVLCDDGARLTVDYVHQDQPDEVHHARIGFEPTNSQ